MAECTARDGGKPEAERRREEEAEAQRRREEEEAETDSGCLFRHSGRFIPPLGAIRGLLFHHFSRAVYSAISGCLGAFIMGDGYSMDVFSFHFWKVWRNK